MRKQIEALLIIMILIVASGLVTGCSYDNNVPVVSFEGLPEDFACASYTADEMREDYMYIAEVFKDKIKYMNTDIYWMEFEWIAELLAREAEKEGWNEIMFYYNARRLLASMQTASMATVGGLPEEVIKRLPFTTLYFGGRLYLGSVDAKAAEYLGWEITGINGMDMERVSEKLSDYISHENSVVLMLEISEQINDFWLLYCAGVTDKETVTLNLTKGDETASIELEAIGLAKLEQTDMAVIAKEATPTGEREGVYYFLERMGDILYLQYNINEYDPEYSLGKLASDVNEQIYDCDCLVIDLRYNRGNGSDSAILYGLYTQIVDYIDNGGKVYALIGSETYAMGVEVAYNLTQYMNAELVGTPARGVINFYYSLYNGICPNSGLVFTYPTKKHSGVSGGNEIFKPDIEADYTIEDYINGRDTVMERVRDMCE